MQRKFDEARDQFMQALQTSNWNDVVVHATTLLLLDDKFSWVWANRGIGLHKMGFHLDAILNYDRAIALEQVATSYNNKGATLFDLEKCDEALKCYEQALAVGPELAQTHMNVGHVYKWQGRDKEAISAYQRAVKTDRNYADGHLALGMLLLRNGYFREGWKHYEWRWKSDQLPPRGLKTPQWTGEDLTKKTILIYAEQGLGDTIQFARYARSLARCFPSCKIIFEAKQPLKRLLETIPEIYAVINFGDKLPVIDYAIPLLTLVARFIHSFEAIPPSIKDYYLNREDVETWGRRLEPLMEHCRGAVKVGICWAGMSRTTQPMAAKIDSLRSTSLDNFSLLAKIPNIAWVSLQKGPPASQIQKPPTGMTIGDFTEDMYDFYETCCAIENCDLVISVDTAVAHAAASIGKPTWVLNRWDGCWRWFGTRSDSPWYPSLRQFVQPSPHDWDGVMQEVAKELMKFVENKSKPELDLTLAN